MVVGNVVTPAAVEELPVLWGHLQVVAHGDVTDELVVAVKDISGGPNIVVEAEQHSVAVRVVQVVTSVIDHLDSVEPGDERSESRKGWVR